ncbi:MAG: hypothetical protein WDW38_010955 [Sanguina aurantia]
MPTHASPKSNKIQTPDNSKCQEKDTSSFCDVAAAQQAVSLSSGKGPQTYPHYVSKTRRLCVRAKVYGLEPSDIPANFLEEMNKSLSCYGTNIVSIGVRSACIEFIIDVCCQVEEGTGARSAAPAVSALHGGPSAARRWGAAAGEAAPAADQAAAGGTGGANQGAPQPLHRAELKPVDWLQLVMQHLPQAVLDAQTPSPSGSWASVSNTQAPDVRGLNLEGAPCITRCPAVLLVSSRGAAGSPAPASTLQLKIAVAWSPKTASAGRALTFTARDSARHLSIEQQRLPREEGDGDDLYHFQVTFSDAREVGEGLLILECRSGELMGNSQPLLVTSDADLALEISHQVQQDLAHAPEGQPMGDMSFLYDVGSFLQYIHATSPAARDSKSAASDANLDGCNLTAQMQQVYSEPSYRTQMQHVAIDVLEHAIISGCKHLTRTLVTGLRSSGCTLAWIQQQLADPGSHSQIVQAELAQIYASCAEAVPLAPRKSADLGHQARMPAPPGASSPGIGSGRGGGTGDADVTQRSASHRIPDQGPPTAAASSSFRKRSLDTSRSAAPSPIQATASSAVHSSVSPISAGSSSIAQSSSVGRTAITAAQANAEYLLWVGQRTLVYTQLWSVLNFLMVGGILLRMSWDGRMLKDGLVLIVYTTMRAVYTLVLWILPQCYIENRESFNECLAAGRMMVKICACLGGHFCCPPEQSGYMLWIDWASDCLMPTVCEPVSLV